MMKRMAAVCAAVAIAGCASAGDRTACVDTCADSARAEGRPVPMHRAMPVFPEAAVRQGVEGCVVTSFVIRADGTADQYQVLDSQPKGVFDAVTLKALNDWRFEVPAKPGRYAQVLEYRMSPGSRNPPKCIATPGYKALNRAETK